MSDPVQRAAARSRVWQLLAMAFSYPLAELHAQLVDGRYQQAVDQSLQTVFGYASDLPRVVTALNAFEAQYIELFATGQRGRPAVPLCAGEYLDLLDGQPRPEFMLRYVRFYRHFGLKTRDQGEDNELPDHLSCQLECLAWLAHLEAQALTAGKTALGYQRAQRDFIAKLLARFSTGLNKLLAQQCAKRDCDPFFAALGQLLHEFQQRNLIEFESIDGVSSRRNTELGVSASQTEDETQDLWG